MNDRRWKVWAKKLDDERKGMHDDEDRIEEEKEYQYWMAFICLKEITLSCLLGRVGMILENRHPTSIQANIFLDLSKVPPIRGIRPKDS